MGSPKKVDVQLNYIIKDSKGRTISRETETMAVAGQKSFMKEFFIPSDTPTGTYMIGLEVLYATTVATASQMFSLVPPPEVAKAAKRNMQTIVLTAATAIILLIGLGVIFRGPRQQRFYKG